MLNVGLTSGAAQIDYFPIINLFRAVLPYTLHLNMEESKSLIPSANGLSIYDVALILPKIKLRSLSLMSCILRSPPASLSKIATGILQPLSSLIQLPRSTKILFTSMMSCFGQAVSLEACIVHVCRQDSRSVNTFATLLFQNCLGI